MTDAQVQPTDAELVHGRGAPDPDAGPTERGAARPPSSDRPSTGVLTRGDVDPDAVTYALHKLADLRALAGTPMRYGRVTLAQEPDPARTRPAVAKVSLDVDGDVVRAHVAARTMHEAVDLLVERLRDALEHRAERRGARRRRGPASPAGAWRHGDHPAERPEYFDRPAGDRQLVRRKTFTPEEVTPEEAAFDMELLDFDFHLFRDLVDHTDAVIERVDGGYRLTLAGEAPGGRPRPAAAIELARQPAPRMSVAAAIERLDLGAERFVLFVDETTGRGAVVYRRYDGHHGLITLG